MKTALSLLLTVTAISVRMPFIRTEIAVGARSAQARPLHATAIHTSHMAARHGHKKAGLHTRLFFNVELARSSSLNLGRLLAFLAIYDLEGHFLPFLERLEALHVDLREMCEQVFAAAIRGDETEALRVIEPFHCAGCHVAFLLKLRISGRAR